MTDIFDFYRDPTKHDDLKAILDLGAQKYPAGLAQNFLEKDIWVAEILRLLYDENLLGAHLTAFKGETALSKCWKAIERFSEDIDLTYHESEIQEAGVHLAETIDRHLLPESGADDTQLPAVSKLPPLVAIYCGQPNLMEVTEAAVRVTNHNDEAVVWIIGPAIVALHGVGGERGIPLSWLAWVADARLSLQTLRRWLTEHNNASARCGEMT